MICTENPTATDLEQTFGFLTTRVVKTEFQTLTLIAHSRTVNLRPRTNPNIS
jgi:hypothetical protein